MTVEFGIIHHFSIVWWKFQRCSAIIGRWNIKGARPYFFSKFSFRFYLKNHHSKDENLKFRLKWSSRLDVRSDFCTLQLSHRPISYCGSLIMVTKYHNQTVLEWVRTRESISESESTRPESESESESESEFIRPESESIKCESESIGPESESESSGSESESESFGRDSAWTHESNNRKVLHFNPTLIIFAELCIDSW